MKFITIAQYDHEIQNLPRTDDFFKQWQPVKVDDEIQFYVSHSFLYQQENSPMNNVLFQVIGNGNFNLVFVFNDPTRNNLKCVFKVALTDIQKIFLTMFWEEIPEEDDIDLLLDDANGCDRSIALWNEINGSTALPARELSLFFSGCEVKGWVTEYFEPAPSIHPDFICHFLFNVQLRCHRIIVDIATPGNLALTSAGEIVCLDVSFALKLARTAHNPRGESPISVSVWSEMREDYHEYFKEMSTQSEDHNNIVSMVKALLFVNELNLKPDEWEKIEFNALIKIRSFLAECYDIEDPRTILRFFDVISQRSFPSVVREKMQEQWPQTDTTTTKTAHLNPGAKCFYPRFYQPHITHLADQGANSTATVNTITTRTSCLRAEAAPFYPQFSFQHHIASTGTSPHVTSSETDIDPASNSLIAKN